MNWLQTDMENNGTIIQLTGVSMKWDRRSVLSDVDLSINKGDFVAITGPNGGGKTTLLRIILKLLRPTSGSVRYFDPSGAEVSHLSIGYLPQKNKIDSHFPITVRQVIASGLMSVKGLSKDVKSGKVEEMLKLMGLEKHGDNGLGEISGGQLQRTLLGRALISEPSVLVLDEPLSYVDKRFERHIYDMMEQLAGHTTIILVSHEMTTIASMANRHIIVDGSLHICHSGSHYAHYDCCDCAD